MRKSKLAGAMVLAVLAISAFGASAAGAAQFTSSVSKTIVSGSQVGTGTLKADSGTIECTGINYSGEAVGTATEYVEMSPVYSGCVVFGFSASITMNGCRYKVYASGPVDIVCPLGGDILLDTAFNSCNVTFPPQTGLTGVTYTNETLNGKGDITADINLTNIKYTETGFACAASGKSTTGGTLVGKATVSGKDTGGNPVTISWDA